MIVLLDNFSLVNNNQYNLLYSLLPIKQKKKVDMCFDNNEKLSKILEYFIVKKYLCFDGIKDFSYTINGKPYLKSFKNFNISYDEGCLAIAFSTKEVGVDVQKNIEYDENLARFIASEEELKIIKNEKDKTIALTKLWVKKESYIKCLGDRISADLRNILKESQNFDFEEKTYKNYQICVCTKKA